MGGPRVGISAVTLLFALLACKKQPHPDPGAVAVDAGTPPAATSSTAAAAAPAASADPPETPCSKAIACCKLVADKAGYKKQDNQCTKLEKYTDARCKAELAQLQQAARVLGLDCNKPK